MQKPKIAVIGAKGFPAWGGAARANEAIFTRLKNHYEITIYAVSSHAKDENYQGLKQIILKTHRNKSFAIIMYYVKSTMHVLFKGNYDLVHVNHLVAGILVPFIKLRFPTVLNVRGMTTINDNKWNSIARSLSNISGWFGIKFADLVITVEKGSLRRLEEHNLRRVVYIPNGVDNNLNNYCLESQKKYDIVFSAARINYLKGLHLLLSALNDLQFRGIIGVIGDLDHVIEYKKALLKLSEGLDTDFIGLIKDKEELFNQIRQSRLFVFPSYSEGMSNMLLEAASLKVPIIASDIEQNTEVFSEKEVLFFKSGDVNDLKNKIAWAFNNYSKLQDRAECAHKKVKKDYNWDKIALMYKNEYSKLLL